MTQNLVGYKIVVYDETGAEVGYRLVERFEVLSNASAYVLYASKELYNNDGVVIRIESSNLNPILMNYAEAFKLMEKKNV